jgi:hypothetical protein
MTERFKLSLWLPADMRARLDLELFSELENRVPHGGYARFFETLLRRHFEEGALDLTPFGIPAIIRGPEASLRQLHDTLVTWHNAEAATTTGAPEHVLP